MKKAHANPELVVLLQCRSKEEADPPQTEDTQSTVIKLLPAA